MSNFLISLFLVLGLLIMCWEFYEVVNTKKKHIAYISMMGHFCTDMKVASLHNLMKK